VCIFVRGAQSFNKIDTILHCAKQTSKVHAVETKLSNLSILALYRAPSLNLTKL